MNARKKNRKDRRHPFTAVVWMRDVSGRGFSLMGGRMNDLWPLFDSLLTNQCQDHAAGNVSDENYDQWRDYGEGDTPLRIRRLLAGGSYYVEADEGVETRRRAGENLAGEERERSGFSSVSNGIAIGSPKCERERETGAKIRHLTEIRDGKSNCRFKRSYGPLSKCHSAFIEL